MQDSKSQVKKRKLPKIAGSPALLKCPIRKDLRSGGMMGKKGNWRRSEGPQEQCGCGNPRAGYALNSPKWERPKQQESSTLCHVEKEFFLNKTRENLQLRLGAGKKSCL